MNKTNPRRALLLFLCGLFILFQGLLTVHPTWASSPLSYGEELGLSPFWEWKSIETEHFQLTFPAELSSVAQKAANALEEAHVLLSPRLHWTPAYRTHVLIVDNTDMANGLTSPALRFGMLFYITPPDNWSSIAHYEDWLRLLAIHEYTHLLNMDPTTGFFYETLRVLLGDVVFPNAIWPAWMLEGLAVYMETALTHAGRGRSTFYEMLLRSAVEENVLDSPQFVTLDKINGTNPYFPGGETAYLFGYQLMKAVASHAPGKEKNLGEMSIRSSSRVPFFINGNLENITGKDWPTFWSEWVKETKKKSEKDLNQIRTFPITPVEFLNPNGYEILGARVSPDEKFLAYSQDSLNRRNGLYLRDLTTGKTKRLCDKLNGVGIAFTPDSKKIIFSSIQQKKQYYLFSDLRMIDLESGTETDLSHALRAKDPDLSADGSLITFTITDQGATHLALATLSMEAGQLTMGTPQILYRSPHFDVLSTPRFSPDGRLIVFTQHRTQEITEDLMVYELEKKTSRVLLKNNSRNRFPVFNSQGDIYFTSDRTGVDNLFLLSLVGTSGARQITNVTTGLWFPAVSSNALYVSAFSTKGWSLGKIELKNLTPLIRAQTQLLTLPAVDVPPPPYVQNLNHEYQVKNYSLFPSLWPRQWAPFLMLDQKGVYVGGEVLGFDSTDRHQYALQLAYHSGAKEGDGIVFYSNRSFGPTISFFFQKFTQNIFINKEDVLAQYSRKSIYSSSLSYPIRFTYSSLVPALSLNAEQKKTHFPNSSPPKDSEISRTVPSADLTLAFSNSEDSRLGITPERGRNTLLGTRLYLDAGVQIWKSLFIDTEHILLGDHHVLVPSLRASTASRSHSTAFDANVVISGRSRPDLFFIPWGGYSGNSFDELALRGYPEVTFLSRAVGVGSIDYRFPLLRIFRGLSTHPFFAKNIFGFAFAESAYFPTSALVLSSVGGGVRLSTEWLLSFPLVFSIEYHKGFREDFGGRGEYFVSLNLNSFEF